MTVTYTTTQAVTSGAPVIDLLKAAGKGRLHEVQSLLDGRRCKVNDEDEVCTGVVCVCLCVSLYVYLGVCPCAVWLGKSIILM